MIFLNTFVILSFYSEIFVNMSTAFFTTIVMLNVGAPCVSRPNKPT